MPTQGSCWASTWNTASPRRGDILKNKLKHMTIRLFGKPQNISPLSLILALVVILRIPNLFEPYWYGDEAIYLTLGEGIRQGLTLYKDIFDHKPPLIYIVAALAGSLFWFKFLLLVSHAVTVYLFHKLTKTLLWTSTMPTSRQANAAILATSLFALFTTLPTLEGNIANAELFMALPIIGGLLVIFSKPENIKRLFLAGLIFSFAILYKVPAAPEIAALVAFWWIANIQDPQKYLGLFRKTLILSLGIALPILLTVVYYFAQNALTQYVAAGFSQNLGYVSSWSIEEGNMTFRAGVLGATLLAILIFKRHFDKMTLFACIWLSFALFASLLSARPYPHYLIQVVAPLALLVTILVNGTQRQRFWVTPFILLFLLAANFYKFSVYPTLPYYQNFLSFIIGAKDHNSYLAHFDQRIPRTYKLAKTIVSTTRSDERIFIWGTEPELYALSRRLPPTRFVTSFHITDFGGTEETLADLQNNPPKYIVINTNETRELPGLRTFLQANYVYIETQGDVELWKKVSANVIRAIRN